ncbi:MAG: sigma-70 family RNA polymerase sigma factor [Gemmatimonadetes bacterium]|nr:sigma-70 family RNA polymerase sigma factor [Gemmatimonadota bacterium]
MLKQLVRQISPRMLEAIRPYARDNDDADDLLQESWLRVMDQLDNFKHNGSFPAWAIAVAKNVARTARRRRERTGEQRAAPESTEEVLDRGPNPEEELLFNEQRELLNSALARLPDRERDIVVLRFIEGRSTAEAAARIGVGGGCGGVPSSARDIGRPGAVAGDRDSGSLRCGRAGTGGRRPRSRARDRRSRPHGDRAGGADPNCLA